jgi:hypothetical protein
VPTRPALYCYLRNAGGGAHGTGASAGLLVGGGAWGTGQYGWCDARVLGGAQRRWAWESRLGRVRLEEFALGDGLEEVGGVVFDGADGGGDFVFGHGSGVVGDE